jgi:hypothetical protein
MQTHACLPLRRGVAPAIGPGKHVMARGHEPKQLVTARAQRQRLPDTLLRQAVKQALRPNSSTA